MARLGIIAGNGDLPKLIAEEKRRGSEPPFVVQFKGLEVDWSSEHDHFTARFEHPEKLFEALTEAGCKQVAMAGGMQRPELNPSSFDPTFSAIMPKLTKAMSQGDDAALKVVLEMFETAGFEVVAPHDALSDLLLDEGCVTLAQPTDYDVDDTARALAILATTGPLDIGQGCVVAGGLCLGIETLQGTAALLEFVAQTDPALRPERGLLMKAPKPGQERRVDLPAIGPDTMDQLARARLSGIVIPAKSVLVINRPEVFARADKLGLFIWSHG